MKKHSMFGFEYIIDIALIVIFALCMLMGTPTTQMAIAYFLIAADLLVIKTFCIAFFKDKKRDYFLFSLFSASLVFLAFSYRLYLGNINKVTIPSIVSIVSIVITISVGLTFCIEGIRQLIRKK